MNHSRRRNHGFRPQIGLTPDHGPRSDGTLMYEVKQAYADAIWEAGGVPWILPYGAEEQVDYLLDRLHGVLVTGGDFDLDPSMYGEAPIRELGKVKAERSAFERKVMQGALDRDMPLLGVCGGMQLLNVLHQGSLFQDIPTQAQEAASHQQKHDRRQPAHPVEVQAGTRLAAILGEGQVMVNSTHHQSVKKVGEGLVTSALAPDGIVEAIESKGARFAIGVQWHPEMLTKTLPVHLSLFRALVKKAKDRRA